MYALVWCACAVAGQSRVVYRRPVNCVRQEVTTGNGQRRHRNLCVHAFCFCLCHMMHLQDMYRTAQHKSRICIYCKILSIYIDHVAYYANPIPPHVMCVCLNLKPEPLSTLHSPAQGSRLKLKPRITSSHKPQASSTRRKSSRLNDSGPPFCLLGAGHTTQCHVTCRGACASCPRACFCGWSSASAPLSPWA